MTEKSQGDAAEKWVKELAHNSRILNDQEYSLEQVAQLFNSRLQLRLHSARLHIDKYFSFANQWIDLILSKQNLPERSSESKKTELTQKLLDLVLATDLIVMLKDNGGQDHLIAIDVTADPQKEQGKLNTIQGRREDGDPKRLNRNLNIPEVRNRLGIDKHAVLVLNPNSPPTYEKVLAELHGFANLPTRTRSINLWSRTQELTQTPQQDTPVAQTPQELWRKYSQETSTNSDIKRQAAIAAKALKDGLAAKLPEILACDPFVQKVQREQGPQIARKHIQTVIRAVSTKLDASKQSHTQQSLQQDPKRGQDLGPQL